MDPALLEELYRAHRPGILRYLESHARGQGEDLAQEVFLRACAASFNPSDDPRRAGKAYLYRIAHNLLVSHYRVLCRRPARSLEEDIAAALAIPDPDREAAPEEALQLREEEAEVSRAMRCLGARDQRIVRLRYAFGLRWRQIGAIVGAGEGAVRQAHHVALARMRAA